MEFSNLNFHVLILLTGRAQQRAEGPGGDYFLFLSSEQDVVEPGKWQ